MSTDTTANAAALRWSAEAEQSVLGGLLLDNDAWDRAATVVQAGDFYSEQHRRIFAAIGELVTACKPADVITVFEHLQRKGAADDCGGMPYLNALAASVPSAANVRRYAEIVREHAARRTLIATADEALAHAGEPGDYAAQVDRIITMFAELQRKDVRKLPRLIADIALERTAYYEALERGEVAAGWPTGIKWIDGRLNGGLQPGRVYLLGARPSGGKSSFAQFISMEIARQALPTLFLSLEMLETEVTDRGVSSIGRVNYTALQTGTMDREDWSRTCEALELFARLPFRIDDQQALTLREIRIKAQSVPGLKVLVLDYLQLCAGTRRDGNRNSEIEEISRGLKALAKELQIAVIALSQLNREVEQRQNKRPRLSDLRDSGAIEQDADVVMFLWPVREFDAEGRRIIGLAIDKNRQGRLGEVGLDFYGDTQRWCESTADIRPPVVQRGQRDDL